MHDYDDYDINGLMFEVVLDDDSCDAGDESPLCSCSC